MLLKDILAVVEGLPEDALHTEVTVCYQDGGINFTAPVHSLLLIPENQYLYDGEVITETDLSIKLQVAQALGEDPGLPLQIYLPKNSLIICAKSKFQ